MRSKILTDSSLRFSIHLSICCTANWCTLLNFAHLSYPPVSCRQTRLCLRLVPRRGFSPLMMMKRTSGRRKKSTMQHKPSLGTGRQTSNNADDLYISIKHTKMFCLLQGLVGHSPPRVMQPVRTVIGQRFLALRFLTQQQTLIQKKEKSPKISWIHSQARARLRQQRVRYVTSHSNV